MMTAASSDRKERAGWWSGHALLRYALGTATYLVLYLALDWASLIPPQPGAALGITPWNPPAGLSVALLLRHGWSFAPAVLVAVAVGDVLFRGLPFASFATLASAGIVALGYGAASAVLRRRISLGLDGHNDLLGLMGVAFVATIAVAGAVVAIYAAGGLLPWQAFAETVLHFWVGDMIGIAVLTPVLLLAFERRRAHWPVQPAIEYVLQTAAIWGGLWAIFGWEPTDHFEYSYVLFLPLIWTALRGGLPGTVWGILATQLGLIVAIKLKGFDAAVTSQFQLLMLAVAVTGLLLASVVKERRRAEASLRESEARLQTVVRTAPDAILTFDEDGTVTSANEAAARMFAAGTGGPVGANVHVLLGVAAGDERTPAGREVAARRLDGSVFPAEVAVGETPLDGRLLSIAVVRDVTSRKQTELWLKEHEAELAHAMRLTATGEMAAALAHELNQPLTALIGFARACQDVLASGGSGARETAMELIDHTVQQALRAGEIIRSTREFLRRGDTRLVKVEVGEIFKAVLDLVHTETALNKVALVTRFTKDLPPVLADPIQIEQVILNLIRNSIEAMVAAEIAEREIALFAASDFDPGFVQIVVRDNGPGVPPEIADRLFRPFSTTKESGMGLGLSISRSIVEAHGGRIWSEPSTHGADIRFTVPRYTEPAP
jgi:signal transduction histidine kinase